MSKKIKKKSNKKIISKIKKVFKSKKNIYIDKGKKHKK